MLTHQQIWAAIDAVAQHLGLSASSLARKAGLDPTTFNRSKRIKPDGQSRWPSTESIAKILNATKLSIDEFVAFIPQNGLATKNIPLKVIAPNLGTSFDTQGMPNALGWTAVSFPNLHEKRAFALEIQSEQFLPIYRSGDIIVIAPETPTRRGDRVFVLQADGAASIEVLGHQTPSLVHFSSLTGGELPPRKMDTIRLIARIVWASQ